MACGVVKGWDGGVVKGKGWDGGVVKVAAPAPWRRGAPHRRSGQTAASNPGGSLAGQPVGRPGPPTAIEGGLVRQAAAPRLRPSHLPCRI